ncbi:acyl carrier protein [Allocatelliglobosispora scoriae]|uniref:Acyl carrier protein n=1 Tax=Allocatelliglobosispora scoriae TaxID=643052 RepID=A0A841BTJ6_9ACTN|nr:phosphopantetheine-binding protein [Allocatelliglobosispora scoriae]MBB5870072.1 acyl carrier protein [Allocatelliglobosispora scoriae]
MAESGLSRSAVEQHVEGIWRDILGMPEGRADATFFELQGQSISAVRIVNRIEDELGIGVDVGLLFEDPDLPTFARAVVAMSGTE